MRYVDALKRTLEVKSPPRRIVSLVPSLTEALFACGLDKAVVGVKPRSELEPFFRLSYEEFLRQNIEGEQSKRVEAYREHGNGVLVAA